MDPTPVQSPPSPEPPLDPGLAAALEELRAPRRTSWLPLFVLSAVAFLLVQRGAASLRQALLVAAVLLVHELGHVLAMRAAGYRDVQVFFVPFFGALTTARAGRVGPARQALVSLAGPVPGILLGGAIFLSPLGDVPLLREAAWMAVLVNAFNLLPLGFLDGGRLLDRLLFQRHRVVEAAFAVLSALGFLALGVWLRDWVLGYLGLLSLVPVPFAYRRAIRAARLRGRLRGGDVAALPREELELVYAAAVDLAGKAAKPKVRASVMRQLHEQATAVPASAGTTLVLTGAWILSLVLAVGAGLVGRLTAG